MFNNDVVDSLISFWENYASKNEIKWNQSFLKWDIPENINADFALTLALPIAHKNKISVQNVAKEIANLVNYKEHGLELDITSQGYINFNFLDSYCYNFLQTVALKKNNRRIQDKSILIEYVSANPTGQLHLGHARNAVIGDTLANVYEYLGYKVIREYYINDRGQQIKSLITSVWYYYCLIFNYPCSEKNIEYKNKIIEDIASLVKRKHGNSLLRKEMDSELFAILRQESLELLLDRIKEELKSCGIVFNHWVSETVICGKNGPDKLLQQLKRKNLIYTQEGAVLLKTTLAGDEKDRVIIKENQDYTYFLPDILYHKDKLSRADILVNIWGAEHHGYVARIKAACRLLNYDVERIKIVLTQLVYFLTPEGKSAKISKRLGTTINLDEVIKMWGKDWLRFSLLAKEPNSSLLISNRNLHEVKKDNLYYIQYAHARCNQLLIKSQKKKINLNHKGLIFSWNKEEKNIIKNLLRFDFVLQAIVNENKPHHLIYYLANLAKNFQTYYQNNFIIDESNLSNTQQKLLLVQAVKETLQTGLNLAVITAPNQM